jgi:hypothetical protein
MGPFTNFTIWLIVGLVATALVANTLQHFAVAAEASAQMASYMPPKAPPMSFLGEAPRRP